MDWVTERELVICIVLVYVIENYSITGLMMVVLFR